MGSAPGTPAPPNHRSEYTFSDGTIGWIDTSGHLINANRDRVDPAGRTTKARGAPGKGFLARRDQHRLFQQQQQQQLNRQRDQLWQQEQQLRRQRQPQANVHSTSASSNYDPRNRQPLQSQPQLQPRPSQHQQQQPHAAPINEPPPVAQAAAKAAATAAPVIYNNSRTFGDSDREEWGPQHDWNGWPEQRDHGYGGGKG